VVLGGDFVDAEACKAGEARRKWCMGGDFVDAEACKAGEARRKLFSVRHSRIEHWGAAYNARAWPTAKPQIPVCASSWR